MLNKQNGITLIALIITIIVMLILVGVTINVALNGGLFKKAETATKQTEEQAILEEMLSMMEITDDGNFNVDRIIGKMREKYDVEYDATNGNATITGKLGKYNYIVSATEIKIKGESEGDLAYLKSYFVGNDLISLLVDTSSFTFTDGRITLDFENFDGSSPELVDGYMYIPVKFNNSIYNLKIEITDESSMVVRDVIKIGDEVAATGNVYTYHFTDSVNADINADFNAYVLGDNDYIIFCHFLWGICGNSVQNSEMSVNFSDNNNKLIISDNMGEITYNRTNENFEYNPYLEDGIYKNGIYYCAETDGYIISFGEDVANFCTAQGQIYGDTIYVRYTDIGNQPDRYEISEDAKTINYKTSEFAGNYVLLENL